jgi:hypothetical protein
VRSLGSNLALPKVAVLGHMVSGCDGNLGANHNARMVLEVNPIPPERTVQSDVISRPLGSFAETLRVRAVHGDRVAMGFSPDLGFTGLGQCVSVTQHAELDRA